MYKAPPALSEKWVLIILAPFLIVGGALFVGLLTAAAALLLRTAFGIYG